MPTDPATAAEIAGYAKTAFGLIKGVIEDELDNKTMVRDIKNAIEEAKDHVILAIQTLELDRLQGDVSGLIARFKLYSPFDEVTGDLIPQEEDTIRDIRDDAITVIGRLREVLIRKPNTDGNLVLDAVPVLATAASLQTAAMVERTRTYGANDINGIPDEMSVVAEDLDFVRERSDMRFGPLKLRPGEPGFNVVGYLFDESFKFEDQDQEPGSFGSFVEIFDGVNVGGVIPVFVDETRKRHMETAFQKIPGAVELLDFKEAVD